MQVIHSFDAQSEGELSLSVGEYVVVRQVLCFPPSGKGYSIVHYILLLYFFFIGNSKIILKWEGNYELQATKYKKEKWMCKTIIPYIYTAQTKMNNMNWDTVKHVLDAPCLAKPPAKLFPERRTCWKTTFEKEDKDLMSLS